MTDRKASKPATGRTASEPRGSEPTRPQAKSERCTARVDDAADNSEQLKGWRAHFGIHPAATLFPLLSDAELRDLADDINTNGLHERITIVHDCAAQQWLILDGRNRLAALELLGHTTCPNAPGNDIYELLGEDDPFDPYAYVHKKLNGHDQFAKVFNGSLDDYWGTLADYNANRAGVFVTVNETDLNGRRGANIKRVRALFVDLDGSQLEPVLTDEEIPEPHIITETSPARWHCYWLIDGMELEYFTNAQKILIARYDSDQAIHDLPRVMRLPGFYHRKGKAHLVKVHSVNRRLRYNAEEFLAVLAKVAPQPEPKQKAQRQQQHHEQNANQRLNTLALANLSAWAPKLFPDADQYNGGYRVSSESLGRDLEEDLGLMPHGIKDFGLHDQPGEAREGKRTAVDVVMEFGKKDYQTAVAWLREQLGLPQEGVSLDDFSAYMPAHNYIYAPTREPWPGSSVNARLGVILLHGADGRPLLNDKGKPKVMPASTWLDQNRSVEQMTWAPGSPMLIKDRHVSDGGWIERNGVTCFNLYLPPNIKPGDATEAGPWLDHVYKVFEADTDHILKWLAHRVQHPEVKINHALVLGSKDQGIGKDTMLEPVKFAVGPWNFTEASPQQMLGRFNGFLKSVILRVNEARDLGDVDRFKFYDHMKAYTAAPPDVLRVDEKHLREHSIINCCGVIISTNHKTNGIFLPAEDRRHYVAWSERVKADFSTDYWRTIWGWYHNGGIAHVVAYLAEYDLSDFDPKAPPPKTQAWHDVVDANRAPEDAELADVIDRLAERDAIMQGLVERPAVITLGLIMKEATGEFAEWLGDRKNRRIIPHRLENCGYTPVRNPVAEDGLWKIDGKRQAVYGTSTLSIKERLKAAQKLT